MFDGSRGAQDAPSRALQDVVLSVVAKAPERYAALNRLGLGWDQRINTASFESAVDLGVGIARIGRDRFYVDPRSCFNFVHLGLDHLAFIRWSSRNLDVQNDADLVIDGRVLLVARLQSPVARIRGHCCIRIGRTKLLVFSALPAFSLDLRSLVGLVLAQHIFHVPLGEAIPAPIGTNERGVDMHNLGPGDLRRQAGLNRALEDLAEPLFAPALADARQTRMMPQFLMQAIAEEPADDELT